MRTYDCPTCRKVTEVEQDKDAPYRPFCSERCKLIDLGRWFDGDYRIPVEEDPEADDDPPADY